MQRSTWLEPVNVVKAALLILSIDAGLGALLSISRLQNQDEEKVSTVALLVYAMVEMLVIIWGIVLLKRQVQRQNMLDAYVIAFLILSLALLPVLALNSRASFIKARILHNECRLNPPDYGSGITISEAIKHCNERVVGLKLSSLLLDLLRAFFQLLVLRAIFMWRTSITRGQEQAALEQAELVQVPGIQQPYAEPAHYFRPAPPYEAQQFNADDASAVKTDVKQV